MMARSRCGSTVWPKPMMPGKASSPARIRASRFCRISSLTVRSWCPLARSSPSGRGLRGVADVGCRLTGGWLVGCTIRHYVDAGAGPHLGRLGWAIRGPALAIDIGGTKLAAGGGRARRPAAHLGPGADPAGPGRRAAVAHAGRADHRGARRGRGRRRPSLAGVGCGCGGPMEWPAGLVSPLNIPAWRSFPLRARLPERLRRHPGPGAQRRDLPGGGRALARRGPGPGQRARHGRLDRGGRRAGPGRPADRGGVRQRRSHRPRRGRPGRRARRAPAAAAAASRRSPAAPRSWPGRRREGWRPDQQDATAKDLADDGAQGHPVGLAAMRRAGRALGIAIASATSLCDLEVVSIGGGLSQAGPLLFDPLEESLRAHARLDFARAGPASCRPRSARAPAWSARPRSSWPPTATGAATEHRARPATLARRSSRPVRPGGDTLQA